jgi:hypothetical protein
VRGGERKGKEGERGERGDKGQRTIEFHVCMCVYVYVRERDESVHLKLEPRARPLDFPSPLSPPPLSHLLHLLHLLTWALKSLMAGPSHRILNPEANASKGFLIERLSKKSVTRSTYLQGGGGNEGEGVRMDE